MKKESEELMEDSWQNEESEDEMERSEELMEDSWYNEESENEVNEVVS